MEQQLGYLEYREVFLDHLDSVLITNSVHMHSEKDFYEDIILKSFDVYQKGNIGSIKEIVSFFHCFLWAMFKNKPSVEKNDDEIIVVK